jgi:hypothetical protein
MILPERIKVASEGKIDYGQAGTTIAHIPEPKLLFYFGTESHREKAKPN